MIPTQFPTPTADKLMQPYGESSPMGILWTFMGSSTAYTIFAGTAGEVLAAIPLLFPSDDAARTVWRPGS